jgi:O-antigen ligase
LSVDKICSAKNYFGLAAILIAFMGLLLLNANINQRINQAIFELKSPLSEVKDTSLGIRRQFQNASLIIIKESYLVGIGQGEFQNKMKQFESQKIVSQGIGEFKTPHNDYLYSFVQLGITGFVGFLAILFIPLLLFLKHRNDSIYNIRIMANIGILLVSCYMIFSLFEVLITYQKQRSAIYFLAIFIPMASILNQKYLHPKLLSRKRI